MSPPAIVIALALHLVAVATMVALSTTTTVVVADPLHAGTAPVVMIIAVARPHPATTTTTRASVIVPLLAQCAGPLPPSMTDTRQRRLAEAIATSRTSLLHHAATRSHTPMATTALRDLAAHRVRTVATRESAHATGR